MIEINNVTKTYKLGTHEIKALRKISITIQPKEFVAIMGPSGSGKSTLMNILGCLDKPSDGSYKLDGIEVKDMNDNQLAKIRNQKIGFVFQSFNLLPRTTALKNVELPLIYAGKYNRTSLAQEALELVGLKERINHKPNELSGGQRQRVAIARALVNKPGLILADEPTGNIDSIAGEEIMEIFQNLNEQGITIVLVTHEENISEHAKRTIRFRDGRIVEDRLIPRRRSAKEELNMLLESEEYKNNNNRHPAMSS
ncbi:MAG: ABC transporter ATP-binding protein [Candidatus Eremiobacterota bacterium]